VANRSRQTESNPNIPQKLTPRQESEKIRVAKNQVIGLKPIPTTSFIPDTSGEGIFGIGLLVPRPRVAIPYDISEVSTKNIPIIKKPLIYSYFFIEYDNSNIYKVFDGSIKSFAVILTLNPITTKDCSEMLRLPVTKITPLTLSEYETGSFLHPKYINDSNLPLSIRYAEIPILKQKTPGRLDNIPLGYPDFDSTPDGVVTRQGPIPSPPYTDFTSSTGATSSVTITPGGTVAFRDTSVSSPWQFAPTGWSWSFGPSASPTGSNQQNPIVTYGATGTYTVILTASNSTGSTTKTKTNFVIVTN
jgi:hypothetical protein